jgi:two-component system, cell cycle sensor histidine kinase and response regulator CckA
MACTHEARKQILIVEDEGIIAADIQSRLERLGYGAPAIARSGEEALQFARSTPFDLVLMDIRLKGDMDGIATAQAMKTELETPVVYITAHADEETINRATQTEPFGYILKPIRDSELRSAVQISIHKHEMERRLRTSEAWLATTLRSIGEGVVATNTNGKVVFLNPVAERLTGWTAPDAYGHLLMEVLSLHEESSGAPAENPIVSLLARAALGAPPRGNRAYTLKSRTGASATVELGCFENRSDELLGSILVLHDIGGRRDLEKRVMQSQRMEAIANLAAGLAHDFNNQLTVILGCAEELCESLPADLQARALEIKHAGSLATALTGQLLTLSRHQMMRTEPLNLNDLISEMQPTITGALGKARALITDLGENLGHVRADRNQLKQVLLNLALNARDAMPLGGELRIETSNFDLRSESSKGQLFPPGPYVRLLVSDGGEGMDKETLARIFEPFFTTKKAGFGTGLGLSMVHSIIVQSGGHVFARSEVGLGTAFEILMPRLGAFQKVRDIGSHRSMAAGVESTPTVLLVEDDDNLRRTMHLHFEREGFQLLEASDGAEAETITERYNEPIHILVTDVIMPGMTGPELADRLAALRPDIKVLFVSGYAHNFLEGEGILDRHQSFLAKPFSGIQLLARVRTLLGTTAPPPSGTPCEWPRTAAGSKRR